MNVYPKVNDKLELMLNDKVVASGKVLDVNIGGKMPTGFNKPSKIKIEVLSEVSNLCINTIKISHGQLVYGIEIDEIYKNKNICKGTSIEGMLCTPKNFS